MQMEKEKLNTTFVETICDLHFDKIHYMIPFPRDIEVPKYDGNGNPNDHVVGYNYPIVCCLWCYINVITVIFQCLPRSVGLQRWFTVSTERSQTLPCADSIYRAHSVIEKIYVWRQFLPSSQGQLRKVSFYRALMVREGKISVYRVYLVTKGFHRIHSVNRALDG